MSGCVESELQKSMYVCMNVNKAFNEYMPSLPTSNIGRTIRVDPNNTNLGYMYWCIIHIHLPNVSDKQYFVFFTPANCFS